MVCSVENTRWPVSAAVSAISMVSRSRISPTRMTFGAWRSAARSASAKVGVSLCSSRWCTVPFLCGCRNSIGSSMVRMCSARVSLIRSMIAASVDDLPEPVGPVTSTMPFLSVAISPSAAGRFSSASVGIVRRDHAHHDREGAALPEDVDAEAAALAARRTRGRTRPAPSACAGPARCRRSGRGRCRAVSSGRSTGSAAIGHRLSSPCRSTCGGRPGEKIRSLMPLPESSIAWIRAGVAIESDTVARAPNTCVRSPAVPAAESYAVVIMWSLECRWGAAHQIYRSVCRFG